MTAPRRTISAILLAASLLAGSLLGCKPEPPTLRTARPTDPPPVGTLELKPPAKPGESDGEARKKLEAMLAAHTGGKPEALQKLKDASYTRIGSIMLNGSGAATTQTVDLAWPARYKTTVEITAERVGTVSVGLGPDGNWISQFNRPPGVALPTPLPKEKLAGGALLSFRRQMQEDACYLLFPFADPSTRVLPADDARLGDKDCHGLHAWTPALEYALLHIDKTTNLLARLAFTGHEQGKDVVKELLFDDAQDFSGLKLGAKVYVRAGVLDVAEWRSLKVKAGQTFEAKHFDNP